MASLAVTERFLAQDRSRAASAVRAIAQTHAALRADVALATHVGDRLFPPSEAELIAELIRRDLPYYDTAISPAFVAGMSRFARDLGILSRDVGYEQVVASPIVFDPET